MADKIIRMLTNSKETSFLEVLAQNRIEITSAAVSS